MANENNPLPAGRKNYNRSTSTSEVEEAVVVQEPTSSPQPEKTEKLQRSWLISQAPALAALLGVIGLTASEMVRQPETVTIDQTRTIQQESDYNDAPIWKRVRTLEAEQLEFESKQREMRDRVEALQEGMRTATKIIMTQRRIVSELQKEIKLASSPKIRGTNVRLVKRRTSDMMPVYVSRSKLYSVEE